MTYAKLLDVATRAGHMQDRCDVIGSGQAGPVLAFSASSEAETRASVAMTGASAVAMPSPKPWLCVQHRADDGARVRLAIRRAGYEVHWPRCLVRQPRKDDVLRPLFPGYLFAQVDPASDPWGALKDIPNVINVVGVRERGRPVIVPAGVVPALIAQAAGAIDGVIDMTPDSAIRPFQRGDKLRVVSGPLAGMLATFQRDQGEDRISVLMLVMGCERPATVKRALVERTA